MTRKISKIIKKKSKFTKKSYICKRPKSQKLESKITNTNAKYRKMSSMLQVSGRNRECASQKLRNAGGLGNLDCHNDHLLHATLALQCCSVFPVSNQNATGVWCPLMYAWMMYNFLYKLTQVLNVPSAKGSASSRQITSRFDFHITISVGRYIV